MKTGFMVAPRQRRIVAGDLGALCLAWMTRAYIVTFGFVTFRVFDDYGPTSRLKPENDLGITLAWA